MSNEELGLFVYGAGTRTHDVNNIYGTFDAVRDLEGHYVWAFTCPPSTNYDPYDMSPVPGKVTMNGKEIPFRYYKSTGRWNPWKVAVDLRKLHMEPGGNYTITISDFATADGRMMEPVDTVFQCTPKLTKTPDYPYTEHDDMTLRVAHEGAVLLKNEDRLLPLTSKRINVFGDSYYRFFNMTAGAGCINPRFSISFLEGMTEYGGFEFNPELYDFYANRFEYLPDQALLERAKAYNDTAIITIARGSRENTDNDPLPGSYYLTEAEEALIASVSAVFEKTVAILNVGYPIDVRWVEKYNIKSVLWFSYAGQYAGRAIADILTGEANPSGRLPDTWSYDYYDHPSAKNFITNDDVPGGCETPHIVNVYEEGLYVGYRYFDTFHVPVAYPFGYGLSYTDFTYRYTGADYDGETLTVTADVTNTGDRAGKYVLQLYVSEPDGKLEKCAHKLIDFQKTRLLAPGESETLTFRTANPELASYDPDLASMIMEKGDYTIFLAEHSNALQDVYTISLASDRCIQKLHNYCVAKENITELSKNAPDSYPKGEHSSCSCDIDAFDFSDTVREHFTVDPLAEYKGNMIYYEEVEQNPELLDNFVAQMSVEELARLCVCAQAWAVDANGVAGSVYILDKYHMKHFYAADGNSALRTKERTVGFPTSNMVCASFNRDMPYAVGRVIAEEAFEKNIHMILAPAINLHRNPLCGRNPEYFSEDPVLCGIMAGSHIKGLQDNNTAAVIKHVIANNAELSRFRSHSVIGERAFRELYLKCFDVALRIDMTDGLMTSYNAANDSYTGRDEELMLGIFRGEMGFDGYIMTDWDSYKTCDPVAAIAAGNCWLTPGSPDDTHTAPIVEGVKNGQIELARLQDNVKHLVKIMVKYTSLHDN
ncbi:MAG: glycoside hydrolase family 3 C-terminal domain-containing protein [Lachnospiraceae bacterium]|nr:glycoside hydrolase family 3 C-terminal domain-containing protein [Lachnospiraceae bacterium]